MINIKSKGDELLETRLNEATNPLNPTLNAIASQAFCEQVLKEAEGHQIAVRLLAHKVQSPQEKEAIYAFSVIDECIRKCGPRFHQEVGKFRFLNELIKVISPKYLALNMPPAVKKRCIECLYSLYKGLPHETKITEAYHMLKKQNIITKDPIYLDDKIYKVESISSEKPHSIFDNSRDAEKLAKLLKSRNPDDLREANRIIKNIVQEDNQRIEMISKRTSEIETMKNNIKLLEEMLSHFEPGAATDDDLDIMKQLVENLEKSRADMFKLSRETDDNDILNDIIKVIDECNFIIKKYWDITTGKSSELSNSLKTENSLIEEDLLGGSYNGSDDLLSKDLQSLGLAYVTEPISNGKKSSPDNQQQVDLYQELLDIFPISKNNESVITNTPISINYNSTNSILSNSKNQAKNQVQKSQSESSISIITTKKPEVKGFEDLDILGKELLNISKKRNNETEIKPYQNQDVELLSNLDDKKFKNSSANDLPLLCSDLGLEESIKSSPVLDIQTSINIDTLHPEISLVPMKTETTSIEPEIKNVDLSSFNISLSSIKPDPLKIPILIYNNPNSKVKVMLHFSNDRPHPNVNILVAQISSENESEVTDVILKFAVSKPMKIYKQNNLTNRIQAHLPFTPSTPLNEIILIFNPKNVSVDLKFHLSYEINGESFLESGHTGSIKF